jgi:hypothetical protein
MKKFSISILSLILVAVFTATAFAQDEDDSKGSWYIGFGLGSGQGWFNIDDYGDFSWDEYFDEAPSASKSPKVTINFGVGAILNPYFHLGFEISAIRQTAEYPADQYITLQENNYYAVGTYYPMVTGFSLKAGLGLNMFLIEADTAYGSDSESYSGYGALVGIGYDFNFGSNFQLGLHADYSKHIYNDKDLNNSSFLSIYVSFYWF